METIHVGSWLRIDPADIKLLEADINYTYIHFFDGSQVMVSTTIKQIFHRLPETEFIRVNRKIVVNTGFIEGYYITQKMDYLLLLDKSKLNITRRRKPELRAYFKQKQHNLFY